MPQNLKPIHINLVDGTHLTDEDRINMAEIGRGVEQALGNCYTDDYIVTIEMVAGEGAPAQGNWDFQITVRKENPVR